VKQWPRGLSRCWYRHRSDSFLLLWLLLEVAAYFALSPYPAVRRVMGVTVVGVLMAGRLAACTCRRPQRRQLVWASALASAVLGLVVFELDRSYYRAEKKLVDHAGREIGQRDPGARVWYCGNGTFEFYAERAGFRRFEAGLQHAQLREGDWVVAIDERAGTPISHLAPFVAEEVAAIPIASRWPMQSRPFHFGGAALQHHEGPLVRGRIFRVTRDLSIETTQGQQPIPVNPG
jgi:hypothetical protein